MSCHISHTNYISFHLSSLWNQRDLCSSLPFVLSLNVSWLADNCWWGCPWSRVTKPFPLESQKRNSMLVMMLNSRMTCSLNVTLFSIFRIIWYPTYIKSILPYKNVKCLIIIICHLFLFARRMWLVMLSFWAAQIWPPLQAALNYSVEKMMLIQYVKENLQCL